MNRSELIKLSIGQIGMALSYNILTMNLQNFFQITAFGGDKNPISWLLAFSVITLAFIAGAFTYLIAGWLSDKTYHRWGRRPYLLTAIPGAIALMLMGFNYLTLGITLAFILLTCLATLYTVTYRIMYTSYFALYQDLTDPADRVKTTVMFSIFGLIGVSGAVVMPLAPNEATATYYSVTIICGAIYIATVLFAYFFGPKEKHQTVTPTQEHPPILQSIRETFKNPDFKNFGISAFFAGFTYSLAMFIIKPFLQWKTDPVSTDSYTPRPFVIPLDFMIIIASLLPIALIIFYFCNYAAKRWGKRRFYQWTLFIGAVTCPFMIFLTNQGTPIFLIIQLYIVIVIILFVVVVILSLQNAILMDITPIGKEATYTGVLFFLVVIPFPLASQLAGTLLSTFNYDVANF
ncbi:MAG: MFS transporter, partial [Candidatus Helarchaeota archaeon]